MSNESIATNECTLYKQVAKSAQDVHEDKSN